MIALRVPGGGGPYTYDGRPYQRHGPTTRVMPRGVYEQRVMEKLHATSRWENQPVPSGVTIADLDEDEIQLTVDNAVDLGRLEPLKRRTTKAILTGLGLIVEGKLINAAVALYGKTQRLQSLYPQCAIRLARFRGKDRLGDFIDNRQYWGHAFALLRRAETFLLDHVPIAGRVVSGRMKREDRPLYPPRATREVVANALCHRDYTIPGGRSAWPCTTTIWRSSTRARCTSTSRPRSWPSRTNPGPGTRSSPAYSTAPESSNSGARAR